MFKNLTLLLLSLFMLTACALHKVTDKQQLCDQAKRQQVFNATNSSFDANYLTRAQHQALANTEQANCVST